MPYWNFKLDLELNKPSQSRIFSLISSYNKNDQLGINFSDLAQIISEQILLQRDHSLDDKIYQLLDNDNQWTQYKQAFDLADAGDKEDSAKILKLLLLVSIDIGIGSENETKGKMNCIKANAWLHWNESEQRCEAKEQLNLKLNCLDCIYDNNNSTDSNAIDSYLTNQETTTTIPSTAIYEVETNESSKKIAAILTFKKDSSKEMLWPTFNLEDKNQNVKSQQTEKQKHRKHRKNKKKKMHKIKKDHFLQNTTVASNLLTFEPQNYPKVSLKETLQQNNIDKYSQNLLKTKKKLKHPKPEIMEGVNDLDLLLPYLKKPRLPKKGIIPWNAKKTPFPVVYFTITIIEGPLSKHFKRSPSNRKRINGARIYLMGLNMPTGYTQITEGSQIKNENVALVRTLNPQTTGPFVEFKIRVENKYGSTCKQFCLDSNQRYRRCSRRIIRLSNYKKFSDPIPFHQTADDALKASWIGRGYYKRRKYDYVLFRCD